MFFAKNLVRFFADKKKIENNLLEILKRYSVSNTDFGQNIEDLGLPVHQCLEIILLLEVESNGLLEDGKAQEIKTLNELVDAVADAVDKNEKKNKS